MSLIEFTSPGSDEVEYVIADDGLISVADLAALLKLCNTRTVRRRLTERRNTSVAFNFRSEQMRHELEEALSQGTDCMVIDRAAGAVATAMLKHEDSVDITNLTPGEVFLLRAAATISGIQTRALCKLVLVSSKPCSVFRPDGDATLCGCEFVTRSARVSTDAYYKQSGEVERPCTQPTDCSLVILTELIVNGLALALVSPRRISLSPMRITAAKAN